MVLLTDGASNAGPEPVEAAGQAAARGVRVYTIGFGTENPGAQSSALRSSVRRQRAGRQLDPGAFGGGGFGGGGGGGGGGFRRAIDEDTLMAVAEATGGTYYPAESADELASVFAELPTNLITKHEVTEISVAFVALGVLLVARDPAWSGLAPLAIAAWVAGLAAVAVAIMAGAGPPAVCAARG